MRSAIENGIAPNIPAGCARRYWARTTASFRPRVWCWVSRQHMGHAATCWSRAGLVAWAMSMAAGEYVSVHSQADTEQADLAP